MNKTQATVLTKTLINKYLPNDWKFAWNKRRSALGVCSYRKQVIGLSEYLIPFISDEEVKDTILHEIAHALSWIRYGEAGHGPAWKQVCLEIGAKPKRCFTGDLIELESRYKVKCPCCNFSFARHRFNKRKIEMFKSGQRWFRCRCKKSRMDIYLNDKKLVDGNKVAATNCV